MAGTQTIRLAIEGMHCSGCASAIESALTKTQGVRSAHVDYLRGRSTVELESGAVSTTALERLIERLGYHARALGIAQAPASGGKREARVELFRVLLAWFGMMQIMMFAYPSYVANDGTLAQTEAQLLNLGSLAITAVVLLISGFPILKAGWYGIVGRTFGMDVPVSIALVAGMIASVITTITGRGDVYYDSVTMFIAFLLTARLFEAHGRRKAAAAIESLAQRVPQTAERLENYPQSQTAMTVPVDALRAGDVLRIASGGYVPADGTLLSAATECDEAWLTGESQPVVRQAGQALRAGSINLLQPVFMRVDKTGRQTELGLIVELMERAARERPALALLADRIARHFTVAVLLLAALAAVVWWSIDPARALPVAIAVLAVSCPCALALAMPATLAAAQGRLARAGMLLTRSAAIEPLARVTTVMLDKTGTLTQGKPEVADFQVAPGTREGEAIHAALVLELGSLHPLAHALRRYAASRGIAARAEAKDATVIPGVGVEATIDGLRYCLGGYAACRKLAGMTAPDALAPRANTWSASWLASEHGWLARFEFADQLKPGAVTLVPELKAAHVKPVLVSGDQAGAVASIAEQLGITDSYAAQTPEQKHTLLKDAQERGEIVAAVGDGINDAPFLAQANVSVAMAKGAPLAQVQADLLMMGDRIDTLSEAIAIARKAHRIMRQNLLWAFVYNISAIPLALAGLLPPWLAALGMSISSLVVVANSLRVAVQPAADTHHTEPTPAAA